MDSNTGRLYPSEAEALAAGVSAQDLVGLTGTEKAIRRVSRKVRMASRHENSRRKARRKQQKASRAANAR